ncbi:Glycerol-3-phosphate cytidylyltransferase [hydrothermal vent metagenome]|uniref:Glycerol-3-phosphate cytidylyltransferase n=1 Tax=hydrothermal vent metagenome TaxID=652676 RepID=A0A3B1BU56_9ZZZZ
MRIEQTEKVIFIDDLGAFAESARAQGKKIVHCHGVFDLLHIGHIKHLEAARMLGDLLLVTVTPDRYVNKGPHRPAFHEVMRAEALAALSSVDAVAVNSWPTAVEAIQIIRPDFYVKGQVPTEGKRDYTDAISLEEEAVVNVGGKLILTDEKTFSASEYINRFIDIFTPEAKRFLERFRKKYSAEEVIGYLQKCASLRIMTIGETIIDEYRFCDALGKSNKEPVLAVLSKQKEVYSGGIAAVANHVANFCDSVSMVSFLGEDWAYKEFLADAMNDNVKPLFFSKKGAPTIVKRRYVEEYLGTKLFEVYEMEHINGDIVMERQIISALEESLDDIDVVIVADYGHGLFSEPIIRHLCDKAKFLAVNTQTNAGNMGFNVITKYPHADYVSIAEPEVRLANHDFHTDLKVLVEKTAEKMGYPKMIVTRGKKGAVYYDRNKDFLETPAFSVKLVDRIGAGDAVLAITAPLIALGTPMDIVGFIGSVVGAEACAIMGNKSSVEPSNLYRHISSLMK